jgi:FO synthase
MGSSRAPVCLRSGANDLGGTLMNESITRAAGAIDGEEMPPERTEDLIGKIGSRSTSANEALLPRRR